MRLGKIGILAALTLSALPATAGESPPPAGTARLNCSVATDGALSNCVLATETPRGQGFGAKALELAKTTKTQARAVAADAVIVPFTFNEPVSLIDRLRLSQPAPADNSTQGGGVSRDWLRRPTEDEMSKAYPPAALEAEMEGAVILACSVSRSGELSDCSVQAETPMGQGFGEAALTLAPKMKMRPIARGVESSGKIRIPIGFKVPPHLAKLPCQLPAPLKGAGSMVGSTAARVETFVC